ncbi:amidase family protein [Nocardioides sp.]|uniref:amidase family protein n=1 Tax=Nocardioides sp. TaxID=35761 RepID=UPI00261DD3A7|nr:amidase family protein [Nocardioides sp.]
MAPPPGPFPTVLAQAAAVRDGAATAESLTQASLERIAALEPEINAFVALRADAALADARTLDAEQRAGTLRGPLHGVPIAIKDENDVAGAPTAYGGRASTTPVPADSEVVRLLRAAGAVVVGKTHMPEFGIWPFTETEAHGVTRNPWDLSRSTAGSSGGTAAAVASGMVAMGIGGDGGGSIRLPASWCGLVGLKPTRGRVSAAPYTDLWRALGTLGPLTHTVADTALVYDVVAGTTPADRFHARPWHTTLTDALTTGTTRALRVCVALDNPTVGPRADADTLTAIDQVATVLTALGHTVVYEEPTYPNVTVPFGVQMLGGVSDEARRVERPRDLERRTRQLALLGRLTTGLGRWAERKGAHVGDTFGAALFHGEGAYDVLLTATTPFPAVPVGQLTGANVVTALRRAAPMASYTALWNVLGNPALALPWGFTAAGLPLGVQLVAAHGAEPLLVALGAELEVQHPEPSRTPSLPSA